MGNFTVKPENIEQQDRTQENPKEDFLNVEEIRAIIRQNKVRRIFYYIRISKN